ncbi:MAG: DUF4911 domain-containing protein [Deltaproteobacteria bacterium]|nr:DUF4911 domain-containing protein [Deltaproteobacteria bacterium]
METTQVRLKIDRSKLSWLKFVMESYEGLALTTTLDPVAGLVLVSVALGAEKDVAELIESMRADLGIVEGWDNLSELANA